MASTLYVNSSWSSCSKDDPIPFGDDILTFGTDAFADIKSAVDEASTTETTTINLVSGEAVTQVLTYNPIPDTTTLFVDDDWASCAPGDPVVVGDKIYIIGREAFADIQSAVNAASATEKTTIKVYNGTYDEDITFRASVLGEQKGDISIVAVGDNAVVTGTFTIGYYVKGGSTEAWTSDLSFEGLKFESYVTGTSASLFIEDTSGDLLVSGCEFTGKIDDAWLTGYPAGATVGNHIFSNCVFQDGYVQSGGQKSTTFDNCTMTECSCNFTRGNSVVLNDCTITKTLTDADGGDSFYVVRADGGVPVTINGGSFNIDSTASAGTVPGDKVWAVLWQKSGEAKWTVSDVMVNYTDAAADNSNLKFENDISTDVNRVTIDDITYKVNGTEASIDELLAGSSGYVGVVNADGSKTLYDDGKNVGSNDDIFVNASWTSTTVPEGKVWGFNAFNSFTNAYNAVAAKGTITVSGDTAVDGTALTDLDKAVTIGGVGEITLGTAAVSAAIAISGVKLTATSLANSGSITASGTATFNIATLTGNDIELTHGTSVTNSTVGGGVELLGEVSFVGNNRVTMVYDFGKYTGGQTGHDTKLIVGAGNSLTMTSTSRYGIGYGDAIDIDGAIVDALTARATLTESDASLTINGGMALQNGGWSYVSTMTVDNAYVILAKNNGYISTNTTKGGNYNFTFTNSVVDATRIHAQAAGSYVNITFSGSDVKFSGVYNIASTGSTTTLTNTVMTVNGTNGNDQKNTNAGTFTMTRSTVTFADAFTNTGTINVQDASKLVLGTVSNTGSINVIGNGNTVTATALSGAGSVTFKNAALDNKISLAGTQGGVRFLGTTSIADPNLALTATFYVGTYGLNAADAENSELTINNDVTFNGTTYVGADNDGATGKTATLDIAAGKTLTVKQFYTRASSQITVNAGSKLLTEYANLKCAITVNGGVAQFESVCGKENSITADNGVIDLGLIQSYDNAGQTYTLTNGSILTVGRILDNNVAITMDSSSILALAPEKANLSNLAITIKDASAFTGVKKLIDMNARYDYTTGEYTTAGYGVTMTVDDYKNIVTNWNDNFTVIDNDLYLANVDVDEVYVNSDWATGGYSYGDAIEGETGKFYGINAFDKVATAYAALSSGGTIHLEDGTSTYELGTKIQIKDGKGFTITGNAAPVDIRTVSMDEDTGDLYVISTDSKNNKKTVLFSGTVIPIFTLGGKDDEPDFANIPASTMNVTNAQFGIAELDARPNGTVNVTNSTLTDHGGNSIIKSYFNGAINVTSSNLEAMQVTTTGYITLNDGATLLDTWQTNLYDNGIITVNAGATFYTSKMTIGHPYNRANPDAARVGKPATLDVNGGTLEGLPTTHAYHYNTTDFLVGNFVENKDVAGLFLIRNGGTATLTHGHGLQIMAQGTMSLTNGTLTVLTVTGSGSDEYAGKIRNAGTITLDVDSSITATELINSGDGSITVDATGFAGGVKKVIDLSQDAALSGVNLINVGETGAKLAYGADGDVVVHNISAANLYVNAAWATGYSVGDKINIGTTEAPVYVYYGISAFDNFKSALAVAQENGGATISFNDMGYTYAAPQTADAYAATVSVPGTYIITGGNGALLNYELELNVAKDKENDYGLTVEDAFITLTKLTTRYNTDVTIKDSRVDFNQFQGGSAYLSIYNGSALTITGSTVGFDPHQSGVQSPDDLPDAGTGAGKYWNWAPRVVVYGKTRITDSKMYIYVGQGNQTGFDVLGNSDTEVKNSTISLAQLNVGNTSDEFSTDRLGQNDDASNLNASLILDNSTVYNTQYRGDNTTKDGIVVGSATNAGVKGAMTVTNGTLVDFTKLTYGDAREIGLQVRSGSTVSISSNSTMKMPKVSNSGTINVTNSTVSAANIDNAGTINVYGTSKISAGGYSGSGRLVFGKIGTTTEITTDGLNASSGDVFIADGASATLTGNGFNLHYIMDSAEKKNSEGHTGYTLTIKDADEFTAYALYPNGNSVINVNNVKYLKTVYFNVYGGTLNLNGTDKTVNTAGWLKHSSGSSTAQVTGVMNVDKTALTVGTIKVLPADGGKLGGTLNATSASLRARYYSVGVAPSSSEADYTTGTNQSALMKLNASEMTLANTDGEPDYAYLKIGSDTYYGTVTMENSTLVQNETEKGQFESPRVMIGAKGTLNIESNSSVTVDIIENAGTITIDGTGSINSAVSITNTGSINITVGGTITAETFTNGGTITIDARGFTGYADVITVTGGDAQMGGTINLTKDEGSKLDVIKHANGSVSVGVVGDDIYFNKAWSTLADGASISVDSGTKTVHKGVDAFAELSDFTATAGKTLHFTSESASTAAVNGMLDGSELVKAQDAADDVTVTIANGTTFFQQKGDLTIGAGVTLAATKLMHFAKDTTITVDGTFQADDNAYLYAGKMIVNGSLTGDDVFLNGSGSNTYELTANGDISVKKLRVGANATLDLAGGNVTTDEGMFVTAATGTVNVNDDASINGGLTNGGTINVADSKALSLTGAVDNTGTINLAAGSTLVSDMITNTNAINGNSGAIEAGSIINGASDGSVKGTITAATLTAGSIVNNNGAAKKGGSTIELTGDLEAGTITNGVAPIVPGTDEPADKALIKADNITAGSITNFGTIGSQTSELKHTLGTIELTGGLDNGLYGNVMADNLNAASLTNFNEVLVNNITIDGLIDNKAGAAIALNNGEGTGHIVINAASVSNAGYIKTLSGGSIKVTGNLFNDTYAELTGDLEKGLIETDSIEADTVTNNGKIDVKVSMDIDGSVTNNASGTINLASGATLDAAAVANNGTINVFGAGKVNSEITGTGKVTFEDATVDGFASTGNDAVFYGDSNLTGEVKFNAGSYIQGFDGYLNTEDSTVTVSNGSLTARNFYVGSTKLGDVTNTLTADNAQILSDAPGNTTTFYVRGYGEMELTNGSQLGNTPGNVVNMMNYGSVTLTDSTAYLNGFVVYGGDINDTDGADGFTTATFTATGSTIDVRGKHGSKFTIVDGFTTSVVVGGKSRKGDGIVNLSDSTFTVGNNEVTADLAIGFAKKGTVNVNDGSTLTVTGTIGIGLAAGTGTLTVDATSTVTANAITFGDNGSINLTIDAADLTEASYTLIDITGTQALDTAKITVNGKAFADGATYGNYTLKLWDGDVMLFKTPVADMTVLSVNADWEGSAYAEQVAKGKYYGINAFGKFTDALGSIVDETTTIDLQSSVTENEVAAPAVYFNHDVAITKSVEEAVTVTLNVTKNSSTAPDTDGKIYFLKDVGTESAKLTFGEGVTLTVPHSAGTAGYGAATYFGYNTGNGMTVEIAGQVNAYVFYNAFGTDLTVTSTGSVTSTESFIVCRTATVTFNGDNKFTEAAPQADLAYASQQGGIVNLNNTVIDAGSWWEMWNRNGIANDGVQLKMNKSTMIAGAFKGTVNNNTGYFVNLTNHSVLDVSGNINIIAAGTFAMTDSSVFGASLTNAGTFTVSGTSRLMIGELNGTITVNDDATLTGSSVVGGSIAVAADSVLTVGDTTETATSFGAVTNAGEIDIDGALVNLGAITNDGTINMDWNDTLTFSGYDGTGLVNINMTGYVSTASGTVMDYTGGGTMDAGKYMLMTGMDATEFNKYFTVSNNDLVLKSSIVVPTTDYPVGQVKKAVADAKANGENLTFSDDEYTVEVVGGTNLLALDDVNTTVNGGTFKVHVNGGTIVVLEDEDDSGKIGTKTAPVNTSVTINDGTFNKTVTGADRFMVGASIIRYGNSELTINGGTFISVVAGGMLYAQETSGSAKIRGDVTLTINGGSFANYVYGGSFAGKKLMASCTSIDVLDSTTTTGPGGNVTIAIDATNAGENGISFGKDLVLGSHGTGKVKKDAKLIFSGSGTITVTGQIWGSSSGDYYNIKADGTRTIDSSIEGDRLLSFTGFTGALVCDKIRGFESFAAIDSDFDLSGAVSLSDIHNWEIGDSTIGGAFVSDFTGDTLTLTSLTSGVIFEDVSRFQLTKTEDGITTSLFNAVQYKDAGNNFVAMNFNADADAIEWASADEKYKLYLANNAETGKTEMRFDIA